MKRRRSTHTKQRPHRPSLSFLGLALLLLLCGLWMGKALAQAPGEALDLSSLPYLQQETLSAQKEPAHFLERILSLDSPLNGYSISKEMREDYKRFFDTEKVHPLSHPDALYYIQSHVPDLNDLKLPSANYEMLALNRFNDWNMFASNPSPEVLAAFSIQNPGMNWLEDEEDFVEVTAFFSQEDSLLVAGYLAADLWRLNAQGEVLERIPFETPSTDTAPKITCIVKHEDRFYFLDSANKHILILDDTFKLQSTLPLPEDTEGSFHSIAIDAKGGLYASKANPIFPNSGLFYWNGSGAWQDMGYFAGKLFSMKGFVYAVNFKHCFAFHPKNFAHYNTYLYSYLYLLEDGRMQIKDAFPNYFAPTSLAVQGNKLYATSLSQGKVFRFHLEHDRLRLEGRPLCATTGFGSFDPGADLSLAVLEDKLVLSSFSAAKTQAFQIPKEER